VAKGQGVMKKWNGGTWDSWQMHNKNLSYAPLTLTDRRVEALQVGWLQATGDRRQTATKAIKNMRGGGGLESAAHPSSFILRPSGPGCILSISSPAES